MSYPKCVKYVENNYDREIVNPYQDALGELIQMAKEFHDSLKKVKYALNSGDEKMIKLLPKAIDQVIDKYSDKPKDWLDSEEFEDLIIYCVKPQASGSFDINKLKQAIRDNYKKEDS